MAGSSKSGRPWLWLVIGAPALAMSLLVLLSGLTLPAERKRYEAAPDCSGSGRVDDCIERLPAVLVDVRPRSGGQYSVELNVLERGVNNIAPRQFETLRHRSEAQHLSTRAKNGTVHVGVWNGRVAQIGTDGGRSFETASSPQRQAAAVPLVGAFLSVLCGVGVWGAMRLRRASGAWRRSAPYDQAFGSTDAKWFRRIGGPFLSLTIGAGLFFLAYRSGWQIGPVASSRSS